MAATTVESLGLKKATCHCCKKPAFISKLSDKPRCHECQYSQPKTADKSWSFLYQKVVRL